MDNTPTTFHGYLYTFRLTNLAVDFATGDITLTVEQAVGDIPTGFLTMRVAQDESRGCFTDEHVDMVGQPTAAVDDGFRALFHFLRSNLSTSATAV